MLVFKEESGFQSWELKEWRILWKAEMLVGCGWFWDALIMSGAANSIPILFFQNVPAVRRSVTPPRSLLHPRHLLSLDVGPHTSLESIWTHSSMAQNLETTKGKWKYPVRSLSAGLTVCTTLIRLDLCWYCDVLLRPSASIICYIFKVSTSDEVKAINCAFLEFLSNFVLNVSQVLPSSVSTTISIIPHPLLTSPQFLHFLCDGLCI